VFPAHINRFNDITSSTAAQRGPSLLRAASPFVPVFLSAQGLRTVDPGVLGGSFYLGRRPRATASASLLRRKRRAHVRLQRLGVLSRIAAVFVLRKGATDEAFTVSPSGPLHIGISHRDLCCDLGLTLSTAC
jgi:hypothetical protein